MSITACFAKPTGLFDNWFNKLVSKVTWGEYCHSEFIISWSETEAIAFLQKHKYDLSVFEKWKNYKGAEDNINLCFYVLWGDVVTYRLLKHSHTNPFYRMPNDIQYTNVSLNLNMEQQHKAVHWLFKQMKKEYDYPGALGFFVPFRSASDEYQSYFCSQLMVCAFHQIKYFTSVNPSSVCPNKLYALIKKHPQLCST